SAHSADVSDSSDHLLSPFSSTTVETPGLVVMMRFCPADSDEDNSIFLPVVTFSSSIEVAGPVIVQTGQASTSPSLTTDVLPSTCVGSSATRSAASGTKGKKPPPPPDAAGVFHTWLSASPYQYGSNALSTNPNFCDTRVWSPRPYS